MFDPSVFWPAFKDAGMLKVATIPGGDEIDVGYTAPDRPRLDGTTLSREHEIEYQSADATLSEGDAVTIDGVGSFRVRSAPTIDEGGDGYFKRAILTKV